MLDEPPLSLGLGVDSALSLLPQERCDLLQLGVPLLTEGSDQGRLEELVDGELELTTTLEGTLSLR